MKVFVTGGAGYIGPHTIRRLVQRGHEVSVFDDLSRGHQYVLDKLGLPSKQIHIGSLLNTSEIDAAIQKSQPDAVIHLAGLALVDESALHPALYWSNNVVGSLNLLNSMRNHQINSLVFSSSCSVYGNGSSAPIAEHQQPDPLNPYAFSKWTVEQMISDFHTAYGLSAITFRYFNAAGADDALMFGEDHDPETHLIPLVYKSILDSTYSLKVFGHDYPTADGTCIRDFIHVEDLADAHCLAIERVKMLSASKKAAFTEIFNLGTGRGASIMEIISKCESISGKKARIEISKRRHGDPAVLVADPSHANKTLGWHASHTLDSILESAWKWSRKQSIGT